MNPHNLVALFTLVLSLALAPARADDQSLDRSLQPIQDEWAETFYRLPESQQVPIFKDLLSRVRHLKSTYPERAEPLIVEAVILCTYAAADWGLSSLSRLDEARKLLIASIDRDPMAMEASAYITLGNLYYRLPGWPISFGDDKQALSYLEAAAKMYPQALDSNYFLGDYWLHNGDYAKALEYLEKADKAPIRRTQRLSDEKIKEELRAALTATHKRQGVRSDFFASILPSME